MQAVASWNLTELPDADICLGTKIVGLWYLPEESALFAAASSGDLLLLEPESGGHEVVSTWHEELPGCKRLHSVVSASHKEPCCIRSFLVVPLDAHHCFGWTVAADSAAPVDGARSPL